MSRDYEADLSIADYDSALSVSGDPDEIERHFAQLGDTAAEQHYKRRMYELAAETAGRQFRKFFADNSIIFVYCRYLRPDVIPDLPRNVDAEERKRRWIEILGAWRGLVRELAGLDPELRALALEVRQLRGTDELVFPFDLREEGVPETLPLAVSVFGEDGKELG